MTYRDKKHFEANYKFFEDEVTRKVIADDEARFSEWVKGVFLEGTVSTERKGKGKGKGKAEGGDIVWE